MFLLLLMGLGTAGLKAQVRIGGNGAPNAAAVLDLNADDTNTGTKGLVLPRVSLTNVSTPLTGTPTVNGMLVYNTGGTLTAGIYFWNGGIWNRMDDAIGNELTDTITGGGLTKSGAGTAANPWKVGIKAGGITGNMIAKGSVSPSVLTTSPADSGKFLISNGSVWVSGWFTLASTYVTTPAAVHKNVTTNPVVVVDTTFSIALNANQGVFIPVPSLDKRTGCYWYGNAFGYAVTTGSGVYIVPLFSHQPGTLSGTVRCIGYGN